MATVNFTKMNGAGNDFILIDSKKNKDFPLTPDLIQKMSDRRKGIGADGILLIEPSPEYDFELKYYNSDGSLGSLCGNGARCSIKYVIENFQLDRNNTTFICNNQIFSGSNVNNDLVTFNLLEPNSLKLDIPIKLRDKQIYGSFIDTGSPHVILFWDELQDFFPNNFHEFDMIQFGKEIRYANEFQPNGTNVNIVYIENDEFFIRTYERGVEDETLACGTGTVAAAIITYFKKNIEPPLSFLTFGNDTLIINFIENNKKISKITLTGPAKINYIGTYKF